MVSVKRKLRFTHFLPAETTVKSRSPLVCVMSAVKLCCWKLGWLPWLCEGQLSVLLGSGGRSSEEWRHHNQTVSSRTKGHAFCQPGAYHETRLQLGIFQSSQELIAWIFWFLVVTVFVSVGVSVHVVVSKCLNVLTLYSSLMPFQTHMPFSLLRNIKGDILQNVLAALLLAVTMNGM